MVASVNTSSESRVPSRNTWRNKSVAKRGYMREAMRVIVLKLREGRLKKLHPNRKKRSHQKLLNKTQSPFRSRD